MTRWAKKRRDAQGANEAVGAFRRRISSYLGDDLGDVVRNLRPMYSHFRKFGLGDEIAQTGFEARPFARRRPTKPSRGDGP